MDWRHGRKQRSGNIVKPGRNAPRLLNVKPLSNGVWITTARQDIALEPNVASGVDLRKPREVFALDVSPVYVSSAASDSAPRFAQNSGGKSTEYQRACSREKLV